MIDTTARRIWAFTIATTALLVWPGGASAEKLVLQAAFPVPSLSLAPVYIAEQAGFFKEEGLEVEIRFSSGGPQATQITASGGADLALVTIEPAIQGYDEPVWARRLHYDRPIEPSIAVMRAVRASSLQLLESLTAEEWSRTGTHSESGAYGIEEWVRIYASHPHDHADQIRRARQNGEP